MYTSCFVYCSGWV